MFKFLRSQLNWNILLGIFFFLKVSVFVLKPGGYFQIRNNQIVRNSLTWCFFFYYLFFSKMTKNGISIQNSSYPWWFLCYWLVLLLWDKKVFSQAKLWSKYMNIVKYCQNQCLTWGTEESQAAKQLLFQA